MYVFMHQIVFTCTTLKTSEATDAWTDQSQEKLTQRPPGDQQLLESAINCVSYLMVWITRAARKRQNSKMLCFKITAAEIHFYAFSLWDHKALYSRSMKKVITT